MAEGDEKRSTDIRFRHGPEQTIELIGGRQDMDYGAISAVVGLALLVVGVPASVLGPAGGLLVIGGLVAIIYGVARFIKGVIRVRSTRGIP